MPTQNIDSSQLSQEDRADIEKMNEARRKQMEAAKIKEVALAGVQPPPEALPPGQQPPPPPPAMTTPGQINSSQQGEIEMADSKRKRDMDAQMAATRAGLPAYAPGSTIDLAQSAAAPGTVQGAPQAATAEVSGVFEVWRATRVGDQDGAVYAANWLSLREVLKGKNGEWLAVHSQFPANVPSILGFLSELESPYDPLPDTDVEKFDVIVKGKKIFRSEVEPDTDPESDPDITITEDT